MIFINLFDFPIDFFNNHTYSLLMAKEGRGGAREGAGRKAMGQNAKTKTMCIVCTESQCNKIKDLAKAENKSISAFCINKILGE